MGSTLAALRSCRSEQWHRMDDQKVIVEKLVRQESSASHRSPPLLTILGDSWRGARYQ